MPAPRGPLVARRCHRPGGPWGSNGPGWPSQSTAPAAGGSPHPLGARMTTAAPIPLVHGTRAYLTRRWPLSTAGGVPRRCVPEQPPRARGRRAGSAADASRAAAGPPVARNEGLQVVAYALVPCRRAVCNPKRFRLAGRDSRGRIAALSPRERAIGGSPCVRRAPGARQPRTRRAARRNVAPRQRLLHGRRLYATTCRPSFPAKGLRTAGEPVGGSDVYGWDAGRGGRVSLCGRR